MVNIIPSSVKKIWDVWNVRGLILLSLSLQIILILGAPFRKRTRNRLVFILIWMSYLLADWAASFTIGLISNIQANSSSSGSSPSDIKSDLLAFWAPFLLLHLGGPDGITAFSLEDNELWLRHFFGFLLQVSATVYVFLLTLPKNKLWIPTFLMFLEGIIKYIERTRSLYLASMDRFRESSLKKPIPGPNYDKLMEEYGAMKDAGLPARIKVTHIPSPYVSEGDMLSFEEKEDKLVEYAYTYFNVFKALIVDLNLSFRDCIESRYFFRRISPQDGLRIIEVELNFFYEVFYTKVVVVHHITGYIFRSVCLGSVVVALALFFFLEKNGFDKFDVGISYTLLIAAIGLDAISFFTIIFSDWTLVLFYRFKRNFIIRPILKKFLHFKKSRWSQSNDSVLNTPLSFRRWSECVSGYNLITYCLNECPKGFQVVNDFSGLSIAKIIINYLLLICDEVLQFLRLCRKKVIDYLGAKGFLDEWRYVSNKPITEKLWKFIFEELREKSKEADDAETSERICSARGAYALWQDLSWSDYKKLIRYIEDVPFDESILLWHVATELCYMEDASDDYREFSKLFSDYMLYLLVMQPTLMSAVAGISQIRLRDTCAEAKKFFIKRGLGPEQKNEACKMILAVSTDIPPAMWKGTLCKSVLFNACMLAKELRELKGQKWEVMSKVWMEMLCYAACHCRANTHVQQVSNGGQLITFVWLLMAHFCFSEQIKITQPPPDLLKLIVDK